MRWCGVGIIEMGMPRKNVFDCLIVFVLLWMTLKVIKDNLHIIHRGYVDYGAD